MAAEQFLFGQPVKKRRVLLEAVDVVDLEMIPDDERIDGEHFGTALDLGKFWFAHGRSRIEQVTYVPVPACE